MKKYAKLVGARNQAGVTQARMAESIGCAYTTYNAKENGRTVFTADDMAKIRDVLSEKLGYTLTIDELFF